MFHNVMFFPVYIPFLVSLAVLHRVKPTVMALYAKSPKTYVTFKWKIWNCSKYHVRGRRARSVLYLVFFMNYIVNWKMAKNETTIMLVKKYDRHKLTSCMMQHHCRYLVDGNSQFYQLHPQLLPTSCPSSPSLLIKHANDSVPAHRSHISFVEKFEKFMNINIYMKYVATHILYWVHH